MRLIKISQSLIIESGEKKNFLEFEGGLQIEVSDAEYEKFYHQFNKPKYYQEEDSVHQL